MEAAQQQAEQMRAALSPNRNSSHSESSNGGHPAIGELPLDANGNSSHMQP